MFFESAQVHDHAKNSQCLKPREQCSTETGNSAHMKLWQNTAIHGEVKPKPKREHQPNCSFLLKITSFATKQASSGSSLDTSADYRKTVPEATHQDMASPHHLHDTFPQFRVKTQETLSWARALLGQHIQSGLHIQGSWTFCPLCSYLLLICSLRQPTPREEQSIQEQWKPLDESNNLY